MRAERLRRSRSNSIGRSARRHRISIALALELGQQSGQHRQFKCLFRLTRPGRGVCVRCVPGIPPAQYSSVSGLCPTMWRGQVVLRTRCAHTVRPAGSPFRVSRCRRPRTNHLASTAAAEIEDFASLLDETLGRDTGFDGSVVTGRVIRLTDEFAIVDVGLKSEGRVALKEFGAPGAPPDVKPGDFIELYVERYEDRDGSIVLSRGKARREAAR